MAQIVKNIKKIINVVFGTSIKEDRLEEIAEHDILPNLEKSLTNSDNMGKNSAEPMVSESSQSSENGGFSNGLKKDTLDKMRKQLPKEVRVEEIITEKDKEERDR